MKTLRFILGDQLSRSISSLEGCDRNRDIILMAEVSGEATYVRHHKQKIALVLSAMRHYAQGLEDEGFRVDYVRLDNQDNTGSFSGELKRAASRHGADRIVVTEPGEWRVLELMQSWEKDLGVPVEIKQDTRFLASRSEFEQWARGRKSLRMEFFYREMRRKTGWLMDGDQPEGGRWNYDAENRKSLPRGLALPEYRVVDSSGPDHARSFRAECGVGDLGIAQTGTGTSRRAAEQAAAAAVLEQLPFAGGGER